MAPFSSHLSHPGDVLYLHFHLLELSYAIQVIFIPNSQIFLEVELSLLGVGPAINIPAFT